MRRFIFIHGTNGCSFWLSRSLTSLKSSSLLILFENRNKRMKLSAWEVSSGLSDAFRKKIMKTWEEFWLFQCHFVKFIFESPEIFETPDGKLISRALNLYRRDLNYLRVTTKGLKLCVGVKKFWKNYWKIGQIYLGKWRFQLSKYLRT
jgi:hypothetical protein